MLSRHSVLGGAEIKAPIPAVGPNKWSRTRFAASGRHQNLMKQAVLIDGFRVRSCPKCLRKGLSRLRSGINGSTLVNPDEALQMQATNTVFLFRSHLSYSLLVDFSTWHDGYALPILVRPLAARRSGKQSLKTFIIERINIDTLSNELHFLKTGKSARRNEGRVMKARESETGSFPSTKGMQHVNSGTVAKLKALRAMRSNLSGDPGTWRPRC